MVKRVKFLSKVITFAFNETVAKYALNTNVNFITIFLIADLIFK